MTAIGFWVVGGLRVHQLDEVYGHRQPGANRANGEDNAQKIFDRQDDGCNFLRWVRRSQREQAKDALREKGSWNHRNAAGQGDHVAGRTQPWLQKSGDAG